MQTRKTPSHACRFALAVFLTVLPGLGGFAEAPAPTVEPVIVLLKPNAGHVNREESDVLWELFQNALTGQNLAIVDRTRLTEVLREQGMDVDELTSGQRNRVGQILGADFLIESRFFELRGAQMASVRAIDVRTTRTLGESLSLGDEEDLLGGLDRLAEKTIAVLNRLGDFEDRLTNAEFALPEVDEGLKSLNIAVFIPEEHLPVQVPDPAAEIRIIEHLTTLGIPVVDLHGAGKEGQDAIPAADIRGQFDEMVARAKSVGADVLILGEAVSQRSGQLRNFVSCRGRVELRVVDVASGRVIFAGSSVRGQSDTSEFAAGKLALEKAADDLTLRILEALSVDRS